MEYLVTSQEMRFCDRNTSGRFHIPPAVLMERAALACFSVIEERQKRLRDACSPLGARAGNRVWVAAGFGNNGGDGLALARLLLQAGYRVDVSLIGPPEKRSELTRQQLASLEAYGASVRRSLPEGEYDIIIDALFGVGLSRPLTGEFLEAVEAINRIPAWVLAADLPSGICADTGAVLGAAVEADVTVSFGFRKRGAFFYPGARYAGKVLCFPCGITPDGFLGRIPQCFTFTESAEELLPRRRPDGNKGTFGKVAVFAGQEGMAGACLLAARGAFGAGCGMVKLVSHPSNRIPLQQALPEAMVASRPEEAAGWADAIVAGPGLGAGEETRELITFLLRETKQPLVLDADALNVLAQDPQRMSLLEELQGNPDTRRPLILTPHPGEMARLSGCSTADVLRDPARFALLWAEKLFAAVLCKTARTVVASPENGLYANGSGNSGMATAGSGDVLAGILGTLAAQETNPFRAACVGVYLHGLAGDRAAHEKGERSMTAGDLADQIAGCLSHAGERRKTVR
ncbi:MAG TPA: NAD(P)H-hydrate dehydratase [Candidatus Eisenbergiella merdigallinarum]|uniref:Bifunctional NAD(P)H-hydrate repair enzyme n=1 Tax=Candidatus Eisenbergiella merdigallinarum TaxID=2838552 RepID=A0A9D2MNS0_9FIRM|nr:NAD(P)H-hydrate dehydratase [Candidatus Eisenbergiella merdigallinarum]